MPMPRLPILAATILLIAGCGHPAALPDAPSDAALSAQGKEKIARAVKGILRRAYDLKDRDQDDVLSAGELGRTKPGGLGFAELDKNKDGKLTFAEFAPAATVATIVGAWRDQLTAAFGGADANSDKKLTAEEWVRRWPMPFNEADRNDNGKVTFPEFENTAVEYSQDQPPSTNPLPLIKPGKPPAPPAPPPGPPAPEPPPAPAPEPPPAEVPAGA